MVVNAPSRCSTKLVKSSSKNKVKMFLKCSPSTQSTIGTLSSRRSSLRQPTPCAKMSFKAIMAPSLPMVKPVLVRHLRSRECPIATKTRESCREPSTTSSSRSRVTPRNNTWSVFPTWRSTTKKSAICSTRRAPSLT